MKEFAVTFPGGKRVAAHFDGFTVETDQAKRFGGEGSAPQPFDLFFVALATCVGISVLEYCTDRELNTDGLGVRLRSDRDGEKKLFTPIRIEVQLPADFPPEHHEGILAEAGSCTVKRHIVTAPEFETVLCPATGQA